MSSLDVVMGHEVRPRVPQTPRRPRVPQTPRPTEPTRVITWLPPVVVTLVHDSRTELTAGRVEEWCTGGLSEPLGR
jgi:hypothetical protein